MAQRAWQAACPDAAQAPTQASRAVGAPARRASSTPHGPRRGASGAGRGDPWRREGPQPQGWQHVQQRHGASAVWPRQVWYSRLRCTVQAPSPLPQGCCFNGLRGPRRGPIIPKPEPVVLSGAPQPVSYRKG